MKLLPLILVILSIDTVINLASAAPKNVQKTAPSQNLTLDNLYRKAQRKFHSGNYKEARPLFEKYLKLSKTTYYKRERLFWVIDAIGRIYLRVERNPNGAILFFERLITSDDRLTQDEEDDIGAWITAAKDWKKFGLKKQKKMSANDLFRSGKKFYEKGLSKQEFPADNSGDADFNIASTYLVLFIVSYDNSKQIGDALYMMGHIRNIMRTDPEYWNENYYLKEAIRRFPNTKLAQKSWRLLDADVRSSYSGSSGDHTPPSMVSMLNRYKKLAFQSKSQGKRKR